MEQQYSADPILLKWFRKDNHPKTLLGLLGVENLELIEKYPRNGKYKDSQLPSWLTKRKGDFSVIGEMRNLKFLRFNAKIEANDFSFLTRLKKLQFIDLENTNFSDCSILLELPSLESVWLPEERNLKNIEVLWQLQKGSSPLQVIRFKEPEYRDPRYDNMKIVDGGDVTLSYEGSSRIQSVNVSMKNSKTYPLWQNFPSEKEYNWANLSDDVKREMTDQLADAIIHKKVYSLWLSMDPWIEDCFLNVEFEGGWAAILYNSCTDVGYMPYNSKHDGDESLCPVEIGGQTPVPKMWALENMELVARIVRYFLEHGQLCPGTKWVVYG